jgi:hypothetical protein
MRFALFGLMAGLLKAQFACYFCVNFYPAFHKKSGFPTRLSQKKSAFHIFSRSGRRHIKWYIVNQWFNNILKEKYWRDDYKLSQLR